jgi:hypothetical protein
MELDRLLKLQWDLRGVALYLINNIELKRVDDNPERLYITFTFLDKRYTIQVTINEVTDLYDIVISEFGFGIMQTITTDDAKACIEDIIAKYTNLDTLDLYILKDALKDRFYLDKTNDTLIVFLPTNHFGASIKIIDGMFSVIIHGEKSTYKSKEYKFESGYEVYNFIANLRSIYLDEDYEGAEDLITLYADLLLEFGSNMLYIEKDELSDCNINIEYFLAYSNPLKLNFNKFDYYDNQIQCTIWEDEFSAKICGNNCVVKSPEDALEWAKAVVEAYNKGEVK